MGCPKEFSVGGGMGAALLKKPDLVKEVNIVILIHLLNQISKIISLLLKDTDHSCPKCVHTNNL
jgi:hypothetical protein